LATYFHWKSIVTMAAAAAAEAMIKTTKQPMEITCRLQHHGAAAASNRNVLAWIPAHDNSNNSSNSNSSNSNNSHNKMMLVYASHAILNMAVPETLCFANGLHETVWHVVHTLRTNLSADGTTVLTAVCRVDCNNPYQSTSSSSTTALACGFSDGSLSIWKRRPERPNISSSSSSNSSGRPNVEEEEEEQEEWKEFVVLSHPAQGRAIVHLTAVSVPVPVTDDNNDDTASTAGTVLLVSGSSAGAVLHHVAQPWNDHPKDASACGKLLSSHTLLDSSIGTVLLRPLPGNNSSSSSSNNSSSNTALLSIGTAAPRHNKIHVYSLVVSTAVAASKAGVDLTVHHHGALSGHEDWITSLDWQVPSASGTSPGAASALLASASQDAKVRLWKFTTTTLAEAPTAATTADVPVLGETENDNDDDDDDDEVSHNDDEEEDQEGESRMEIIDRTQGTVTSVTLEALLIGHEESVTSVSWHPNPMEVYGQGSLLITSSMDRSILLWTPGTDGIWTPLSRVGSAGGILGGSVGSTLLGFVRTTIEPTAGRWLVGHAFGGALHVWSMDDTAVRESSADDLAALQVEERASLVHWRATPCVTGHFEGVTDLCWEAATGEYLLTVSIDQTCRLWGLVPNTQGESVWVELARPQVHGYDLSAIASLSTAKHPHLLVTGADEKEMRVFDAPRTTLRILKAARGTDFNEDPVERMERAYIPSLGLSNQASAADGAEEDQSDAAEQVRASLENASLEKMRLPLERDLGAVSLWPENRKLFGHNTELFCLASTLAARTSGSLYKAPSDIFMEDVVVASSAKARDIEAASIRLWSVEQGKCLQVLTGGHKSTVATLSFSPDGRYLASSGKDRRLCVWKRDETTRDFALAFAKDSAHKRIIWSVHFCPFDESILASGSRDGCVKLWKVHETDAGLEASELYSFAPFFHREQKPDAVTALAFAPISIDAETALLALGLESGRIEIWKTPLASDASSKSTLIMNLQPSLCHVATITKLAWRPLYPVDRDATSSNMPLFLASSSLDHGCRIFEVAW
jgi:elongator complex protein 2